MGATGWCYFIPFEPNVEKALSKLRAKVFHERDYEDPRLIFEGVTRPREREGILKSFLVGVPKARRKLVRDVVMNGQLPPEPESIAELIGMAAESGTHSIIDIEGLSKRAEPFRAAPFSRDALKAVFGTVTPTREQVEDKLDELYDLRGRWEASYVVTFESGRPSEIAFFGFSGD